MSLKRKLVTPGRVAGTLWTAIGPGPDYIEPTSGWRKPRTICRCDCGAERVLLNRVLSPTSKQRSGGCKKCIGLSQRIPTVGSKECQLCKITKDIETNFSILNKEKGSRNSHCKDCIKKQASIYRANFKDKITRYYHLNKKKICAQRKQKYHEKPEHRIYSILRTRMRQIITGRGFSKAASSKKLFGEDLLTVKKHLERQFDDKMTWKNYGFGSDKWNFDHMVPCSAFNFANEFEQRACFNYLNLQPMWQIDNMKKGGTNVKNYNKEKQQLIMVLRALGYL